MDSNVPAPLPLMIHVDLNHHPSPPPHEFFFPDYPDHYPSSRYSAPSSSTSHAEISGHALFPRPRQPHHGNDHPDHTNSVEKMLIAQGGLLRHQLDDDAIKGKNSIYSRDHDHVRPQEYCSAKWLSSKMRIMKKMTGLGKPSAIHNPGSNSNHKASIMIPPRAPDLQENENSSSANITRTSGSGIDSSSNNNKNNNPIIIRVCADCSTTKTPLWRSGPTGPKSLCNACGIRQRKARRAMAAAAVAADGEVPPQPNPAPKKAQPRKKRSLSRDNDDDNDGSDPRTKKKPKTLLHLKVCSRDLRFEEFVMKLREWISDFQGVFPQDEKEAAILLMSLSYGSVPG